jgi:hypothetical protein
MGLGVAGKTVVWPNVFILCATNASGTLDGVGRAIPILWWIGNSPDIARVVKR